MLQDRLKLVADEESAIENRLIELKGKLHQTNKPVSPELVEELQQNFINEYEGASRERKKLLI